MENKEILGFWVSLPDETYRECLEGLRENGYPADNDGIKKWLVDTLTGEAGEIEEEEEEETFGEKLGKILEENPEAISFCLNGGKKLLGNLIRRGKA